MNTKDDNGGYDIEDDKYMYSNNNFGKVYKNNCTDISDITTTATDDNK